MTGEPAPPAAAGLPALAPREAKRLIERGAWLVDIRSPEEFARSHVAGAENHPLGTAGPRDMPASSTAPGDGAQVIFMCRTGLRSAASAADLRGWCSGEAYVLEGGLEGWRKAGLPTTESASGQIPPDRQAQILAGSLILFALVFGVVQSLWWLLLAALAAADITYAGATGRSLIARALALLPWNRSPRR